MSRASFRQAHIQRIFRAARETGSIVQIDLRTLVVTILPAAEPIPMPLERYGSEDWDD